MDRYHSQGCTTLSYTAPFSIFFYSSDAACLRQIAAAAEAQAQRGQVQAAPQNKPHSSSDSLTHSPLQRIIVHLHSNTGAFTFAALLAAGPSLRPAAVVWDSAPAWSPALEPALLKSATARTRAASASVTLRAGTNHQAARCTGCGSCCTSAVPPRCRCSRPPFPLCFIVTLH